LTVCGLPSINPPPAAPLLIVERPLGRILSGVYGCIQIQTPRQSRIFPRLSHGETRISTAC
jgi:hypothetical protein